MILQKFLFIGLGGSGGKTLRFLKRDIRQWMESNGQGNRVPEGWKFLHIDTPTTPDGNEINDIVPQLAEDEYLGLINVGIDMHAVQSNLDSKNNLHSEMRSWRIPPSRVLVPLDEGAGQFRAIGRTVAMWTSGRMKQIIAEALDELSEAEVQSQLKTISNDVNGDDTGESKTHVIIVSSLAGGTGAGLIQDVCDIIRAMGNTEYSNQIFGILYAAEAFDALVSDQTKGVQPNTLAAVSELLNGHWHNGDKDANANNETNPVIHDEVLKGAGLPSQILRSGPNFPFLVGRKGTGGIDYESPIKLFEMVGRSLLSWVTSPTVQDKFIAYTITNWETAAEGRDMDDAENDQLVNRGSKDEHGLPAFSGLGFGRLSVGTDYFEEYATQRIVRSAHAQAKDFHDTSDLAKEYKESLGTNDANEVAKKLAKDNLDKFLSLAKLDEVGPEANDIIDDLKPDDNSRLRSELDKTVKKLAQLDKPGIKQSSNDWRLAISKAMTLAKQDYRKAYRDGMNTKSGVWVGLSQERVISAVEWFLSRIGIEATSRLCALAGEILETKTVNDLEAEAQTAYGYSEGNGNAACEFGLKEIVGQDGNLPSEAEILQTAYKKCCNNEAFYGEYLRKTRAKELCGEISEKLLKPLAKSLHDAQMKAGTDWNNASKGDKPIASFIPWNDEEPPGAVMPPAGEFTLIEPKEYPDIFMDLMRKQTSQSEDDAVQRSAQRAVLCTDWLREKEDTNSKEIRELLTIDVKSSWSPSADWLDELPTNLRVVIQTDKDSLLRRARYWLREQGTPMGEFMATSIRSYLGDGDIHAAEKLTDMERESRRSRFMAQFIATYESSAPLVNIDPSCLIQVHKNSAQNGLALERVFSEIPLDSHPVGAEMMEYLESKEQKTNDHNSATLNIDSNINHIDITAFLAAPVSPMVIDSIWKPIAETYETTKAAGGMSSFWLRRRARPFEKFIPAPQQTIMAMIRGWVTARFLGILSESQIGAEGTQISIGMPGKLEPSKFPFPLLTKPWKKLDELPVVLESLGLAYMEVNTRDNLKPLSPYIRLRDLGSQVEKPTLFDYETLSEPLRSWIETGKFPSEGLTTPTLAKYDADTAEARLSALKSEIRNWQNSYDNNLKKFEADLEVNPAEMSAENKLFPGLIRMIQLALDQMTEAATHHSLDGEWVDGGSDEGDDVG